MHTTHRRFSVLTSCIGAAALLAACGGRAAAPTGPEHIRGTLEGVDGLVLRVTTPAGSVRVRLTPSTHVATVVKSDRAHITDGSFLGIASVTQPDGSQRAVEITVFPESMRGAGEGSYAWDLPSVEGGGNMTNGRAESKMTNGTVSSSKMTNGTVTAHDGGSSLTLQYTDGNSRGSQTIAVPPDIPVVGLEPGDAGDLKRGEHVFVVANRNPEGVLTADRVVAGKDGVVPPM